MVTGLTVTRRGRRLPRTRTAHPGVPVVLRWAGVAAGVLLAAFATSSARDVLLALPALAIAALRTAELRRNERQPGVGFGWPGLVVEFAACAGAVLLSGGWHSPLAVTLLSEAAAIGASAPSRRAGPAAACGLVGLVAISVGGSAGVPTPTRIAWEVVMVSVGLTTAYASWIFSRSEQTKADLTAENQKLAATNELLVALDRMAIGGPKVLDPLQCARAVGELVHWFMNPQVLVVATTTPLAGHWQVLLAEGVSTDALLDERRVPALAAVSAGWQGPFFAASSALAAGSKSAVCIPLRIHDTLVGALLVEHANPERWSPDDLDDLTGLAQRSALMLDNARRFNSLWVIGGSEERRRVARDLHDHLGQRMAALGLELDGLARRVEDPEVRDALRGLRADLTGQIRDLRAAMSDLSCDVSERKDLSEALAQMVDRLNGRFSATITLDSIATSRLALGQEHQLLLVARDMLTSAMVECRATRVELRWRCGEGGATLEVVHDGSKPAPDDVFDPPLGGHLDGLTQVQERCLAIGGSMETGSEESGDYLRVTVAR